MATAELTKGFCGYGESNTSSWDSSLSIYSGESGGTYYIGKLELSTAGLEIGKSQSLVIDVELNTNSSPKGCIGVLSTRGDLKPYQVPNSDNSGPSATVLGDGFIASSYASPQKTDMASGEHFTLTFNTDKIESDKVYYLYLMRSLHFSGYTGSGYCRTTNGRVVATLTYEDYYCVQIGNGSGFDKYAIYIHDGTSFAKYREYIHDGTGWVPYS